MGELEAGWRSVAERRHKEGGQYRREWREEGSRQGGRRDRCCESTLAVRWPSAFAFRTWSVAASRGTGSQCKASNGDMPSLWLSRSGSGRHGTHTPVSTAHEHVEPDQRLIWYCSCCAGDRRQEARTRGSKGKPVFTFQLLGSLSHSRTPLPPLTLVVPPAASGTQPTRASHAASGPDTAMPRPAAVCGICKTPHAVRLIRATPTAATRATLRRRRRRAAPRALPVRPHVRRVSPAPAAPRAAAGAAAATAPSPPPPLSLPAPTRTPCTRIATAARPFSPAPRPRTAPLTRRSPQAGSSTRAWCPTHPTPMRASRAARR